MRALISPTLAVAGFTCLLAAVSTDQTGDRQQELAAKIVHDVLHVKPNTTIVITGDASESELTGDIALAVREVGAFAITDIGSNRVRRLYFERVPAAFDDQPPKDLIGLASIATAFVNISYPVDKSVNAGVPPVRLQALQRGQVAFNEYLLRHNIPEINVGNGVFPSPGNAAKFGVSESELADLFWSGVNADYAQIRRDARGMALATTHGAHTIHMTAPNGTDFTFVTIAGSAVMNNGSVTAEDLQRGGGALEKQLPAGDVYVLPKPGSANGVIVFGIEPLNTGNLSGLTVHVNKGVVTSMRADAGFEPVRKLYDLGTAGRDRFAWADFPVNRAINVGPGTWGAGPSMAAGWVTAGIGNNLPFGGSDASSFALSSNIPNVTVTVDGKAVITGGQLSL
jgi:leucyl aminopeptidase (aminopeptidase T)